MRRNRKHKDKVFVMVFKRPEDLLDLYNGLNKSHYDNPDDLEITTLEDAIYIHMKNDISFLIDNTLNLWEHQSSYNPNMPVRGLSYQRRSMRMAVGKRLREKLSVSADVAEEYLAAYWKENIKAEQVITCENGG